MAHEDLLRILGVDGNLTPAAVVTLATERAIETNFWAAAVSIERDAALGHRLGELGVRLNLIDVHITGPCQGVVKVWWRSGGRCYAVFRLMTNRLILSAKDEALLRLLDHTPATTTLILKASESFPGDASHNERRVRERLQSLAEARFVRVFPATHGVGGPINW